MSSNEKAHRTLSCGLVSLALTLMVPLAAGASPQTSDEAPDIEAAASTATPSPASENGYDTITYTSTFTTKTVDINHTLKRGYKWYLLDLFGRQASASGVKLNSDGSLSLLGDNTGAAGQLASMVPYRGTNSYVGTAFGGGFYMQTVFNFNYADVKKTHPTGAVHVTTPAFWSLAAESVGFSGTDQWPGQAKGYQHNVEFDFFEADYWTTQNAYGMGLHDWWGIPGKTCSPGLCGLGFLNPSGERVVPKGTNFGAYHTYGTLWVPATAKTKGFTASYFDGALIGQNTHTWTEYTNQAPTPVGKSWAFGRLDQQHMFFIIGSGAGQPFNVKSVTVWQKNASKNLVN